MTGVDSSGDFIKLRAEATKDPGVLLKSTRLKWGAKTRAIRARGFLAFGPLRAVSCHRRAKTPPVLELKVSYRMTKIKPFCHRTKGNKK